MTLVKFDLIKLLTITEKHEINSRLTLMVGFVVEETFSVYIFDIVTSYSSQLVTVNTTISIISDGNGTYVDKVRMLIRYLCLIRIIWFSY